MTGERAIAILDALERGKPGFTADEIEELLAAGLAIEADPDDFATIDSLTPIVREHANVEVGDGIAVANLMTALAEVDRRLKSDWYRFTTSDEKIAVQEKARIAIRRALGVLNDPIAAARIAKLQENSRGLAEGTKFVADEALGLEIYAITKLGAQIKTQLAARADRYGNAPLAAFLKQHDKVAAKMHAFSADIAMLSRGIGQVKKNPHQVVIGLAKANAPAKDALGEYLMMRQVSAPDVAVTVARNGFALGGSDHAAKRLREAKSAMRRLGFAETQLADGAAKTLLAFDSLDEGAQRFRALFDGVTQARLANGEAVYKAAARLMPAHGDAATVLARAKAAAALLKQYPSVVERDRKPNLNAVAINAVALASMVKDEAALAPLVTRFRELEKALFQAGISTRNSADDDALECVACAGTPAEVVAIVKALLAELAPDRNTNRADVAIAVSFAKRFAY